MGLLGEHLAQFLSILVVCILTAVILKRLVDFGRSIRAYIREKLRKKRAKLAKPDPWEVKYGYNWDYVIAVGVMDAEKEATPFQKRFSLKKIVQRISQSGLEANMFFSIRRDVVFVKIRCPLHRLQEEADRINLRLLLDDVELSKRCSLGKQDPEKGTWLWRPFQVPDHDPLVKKMCGSGPFDYLHYKYESPVTRPEVQPLYHRHKAEKNAVFRSVDRIKLIISILKAPESLGGCAMDPCELAAKQAVVAAFPLHSPDALHKADCTVLTVCQMPWRLDVHTLRDYFGEKIGFYFLFLSHYTTWLLVPALLGIFVWMDVTATGNADSASVPVLCVFVAIWTTLFLEFWKRKQKTHAMMWGHTQYREQEQPRPNFKGEKAVDPVTGRPTLFFPESQYLMRLAFSQTTILGMVVVVAGVVSSIFVLKWFLLKPPQDRRVALAGMPLGGIIASFANAVQIQVTNALYQNLALWLTDLENHRTETAYEDSLIAKTFLFQFVNSYASLVYIAFAKQYLEGCTPDCMAELGTTLGTIFITRIVTSNVTAVLVPYLKMAMAKRQVREQRKEELSPVEEQFLQEHYDVTLGPFGDYLELAVQYGYSTLFVSAFPLALVMSLFNNYLQIRADGWKLCQLVRRPEPRGAEDIGTWYLILEVLSIVAVICNSAIIFFTGTRFDGYSLYDRAIFFIVFEHALLCIKGACALFIPDTPTDVEIQLKRQDYITAKVFQDAPDDNDDGFVAPKNNLVDLNVFLSDDEYL